MVWVCFISMTIMIGILNTFRTIVPRWWRQNHHEAQENPEGAQENSEEAQENPEGVLVDLGVGDASLPDELSPNLMQCLYYDQTCSDANYGGNTNERRPTASQQSGFRTGRITALSIQEGVIDNRFHFDRRDAPEEGLKVGVNVTYHLYRLSVEHDWRVKKVVIVQDENWNTGEDAVGDVSIEEPIASEDDTSITGITGITGTRGAVSGEVKRRDNREVLVRTFQKLVNGGCVTVDTTFDLDKLDSGFNPMQGDIILMDAIVEVSEDRENGIGEVLHVKSIKPLNSRTHVGIVTEWHCQRQRQRQITNHGWGIISNEIHFEKAACDTAYIPKVKDEVDVEMIGCERGRFKWRALFVTPITFSQYTSERREMPERLYKVDPELLKNKGDLIVQEITDFGALSAADKNKIQVHVTNVGESRKKITKYYLDSEPSNLKILSPVSKSFVIEAQDNVTFCFDYNKESPGFFSEVFVIQCEDFEIGREIKWEVYNADIPPNEEKTKIQDREDLNNTRGDMAQKYMSIQESRGTWLPGVRPWKAPSFVAVRLPGYAMDDQIKKIMTSGSEGRLVAKKDSINALKESCPELAQNLSSVNHNRRFHHLLFIAEVDAQIDMSRHTKQRVSFIRKGQASEYLALEIPGLAEGRPSLLVGDSIVATQSSDSKAARLSGFIHRVQKNEVWLKFDAYVHSTYNGEDYDIYFNLSRGVFRKCHAALDLCQKNQANLWLFPKGVRTKCPQIEIEVPEDAEDDFADITEQAVSVENQRRSKTALLDLVKSKNRLPTSPPKEQITDNSDVPCNRRVKLTWFNTRLNQRQKEAVHNILVGEGRPLPYVIFGPPGTGKTVTLVEAVLQIYTLISSSRILIATPSNSSANLVAERLLDSNLLQQGDMVRLVANHMVAEGKVPPRLVPHSATVDTSHCSKEKDESEKLEGTQAYNSRLLMSRRIIVGTCMVMGQMLQLGLPRGHFSHIAIDEAGQATEPEVLIPLAFLAHEVGQAILAGDPHQLGPVVQSNIASSLGLSQSLLGRLLPRFPYQRDAIGFPESGGYDPRLVTRLTVNYRSLPDILELPSTLFYDCDLEPSLSDTNSYEAKLLARITQKLELPDSAVIFHGVCGEERQENDSPSFFNYQEVYVVVKYVKQLLDAEVKSEDIGIITPYQKQVAKIRSYLEKLIPDAEDKVQSIKVGSVEEFQGQERMVIILSTVRTIGSNHVEMITRNTARQLLGFVNNKERLNVAISRARALLLICADPKVLAVDCYWRSVLKYCVEKNSFIGSGIQKSLIG